MNRNIFIVPFLSFLILFGCKKQETKIGSAELTIDSAKVESHRFFNESSGYGIIEPVKSITLEAKFDGIIRFVKTTGILKKGEIIYRLTGNEIINHKSLLQKNYNITKSDYTYLSSVFRRKKEMAEKKFLSPESFDKYKRDYETAKLKYEKAEKSLNYFLQMISYNAPFDGYISNIKVPQGADVKVGEQIAKFENQDEIKLVADFYDNPTLLTSKNLLLSINSELVKGNILYLERTINPQTGGHTIWIRLKKTNDLIPGKYVSYKYLYNAHFSPAIPVKSIVLNKGNYFVVVADNGKYIQQKVVPGVRENGKIEILKGLKNNEVVLTKGAFEYYYGNLTKTMNVGD